MTRQCDASLPASVNALAHWQKAALLAASTLLGENAASALGGLVGGARCIAALHDLRSLERAERARILARLELLLDRAVPAGLADVHESWRGRALRAMDPRLTMAQITDHIDARDAAGARSRWLARAAFARLVPMPRPTAVVPAPPRVRDLPRLEPAHLVHALGKVGLEQLAWALCRPVHGHEQLIRVAEQLPAHGQALLERIRELRAAANSRLHGPRRWAVIRCRGIDLGGDPYAVERLAARALAPHLCDAGGDVARQLAQRLPFGVGSVVYAEQLGFHGRLGLATVPPWHVLGRWFGAPRP